MVGEAFGEAFRALLGLIVVAAIVALLVGIVLGVLAMRGCSKYHVKIERVEAKEVSNGKCSRLPCCSGHSNQTTNGLCLCTDRTTKAPPPFTPCSRRCQPLVHKHPPRRPSTSPHQSRTPYLGRISTVRVVFVTPSDARTPPTGVMSMHVHERQTSLSLTIRRFVDDKGVRATLRSGPFHYGDLGQGR